eukprot:c19844_g2_i1.p1 GENE.c19844_g2_i1~~c19844_g2_i1.p1  ORF type:complete len:637 (-),score=245.68 c19844_g2_i1:1197-3107(-)
MVRCCCCSSPQQNECVRDDLSPVEDRKIRDIIWLVIFFLATIASIVVSFQAKANGNLDVLRYGISSNSTLCGHGKEFFFPKLIYCFNTTGGSTPSYQSTFSVCGINCPTNEVELIGIYLQKADEFVTATGTAKEQWEDNNFALLLTSCVSPSTSILNRCLFDFSVLNATARGLNFNVTKAGTTSGSLGSADQMFLNAYNDLTDSYVVILVVGILGALILSFTWLQLLTCFAPILVWTTLLIFFIALIVLDIFLAMKAGFYSNDLLSDSTNASNNSNAPYTSEYQEYYKILFYIFIVLTVAFACLVVFLLSRIRLAIALIRESAHVIRTLPQLMITPLIPAILLGFLLVYGIIFGSYLASCGTISNGHLVWDTTLRYAMIYHISYILWAMFIILGLHSVTLAGVVAAFYWTRDKDELSSPLISTLRRTIRYHLGSICFGSFILTVIKLIKWALQYMTHYLKKNGATANPIIKYLLCCLNCLVALFERFIRFLTKNAYIMIAVEGESFCNAAGQAWNLIASNIARMTAVNWVTGFLFIMAKFGVAFLCGAVTSWWLDNQFLGTAPVTSAFAPSVCTFILAYFVSSGFFEISDFTIDTLLLCFCLDDIRNRESGNYYASTRLLKFMARAPKMQHQGQMK